MPIWVDVQALGKLLHFFWKKEYQSRGAPHYHVLVWIEGAPVIGKTDLKDVLHFIQRHVTCRIPEQATNQIIEFMIQIKSSVV